MKQCCVHKFAVLNMLAISVISCLNERMDVHLLRTVFLIEAI